MVEKKPFDRVGLSGWLHMPMVDRHVKDFTKATIDFTENNHWDFIKLMSNGHYFAEAYGAEIEWLNDPQEWSGKFIKYPIETKDDLLNLKQIDPKTNPVFQREIAIAKNICEYYNGEKPVIATIFTPLTWIQEMMCSTVPEPAMKMMKEEPNAVHHALQVLLETNLALLDEFIKVGIDGIFLSTQYGTSNLIDKAGLDTFCHPYDLALLDYVKGRTWFNMLHIHYHENLMIEEFADYPVQAINWENCTRCEDHTKLTSIADMRCVTDKVLIGGIDQHTDFITLTNDRDEVKERLRRRFLTALDECKDNRFIFAPGCAMPLTVDRYLFTLMYEVVCEEGILKG